MSLVILEGLWKRPKASESVCLEAIGRHDAAKRIAQWCSKKFRSRVCDEPCRKKQRITKPMKLYGSRSKYDENISELWLSLEKSSYEHWLFRALESPSLLIRQWVTRILLRHKPPIDVLLDHMRQSAISEGEIQCFGLLTEISGIHLRTWKWVIKQLSSPSTSTKRLLLCIAYCHTMCQQQQGNDRNYFLNFVWSSAERLASFMTAYFRLMDEGISAHPVTKWLEKLIDPSTSLSMQIYGSENSNSFVPGNSSTLDQQDSNIVADMHQDEDDDDDDDDEDQDIDDDDDAEEEGEEGEDDKEGNYFVKDCDDDDDDDDEECEERNEDIQVESQENDIDMTEAEQEIVDVVRHFEARLLDINEQETPQMPVRSENTTSAPLDNKRRTMFLQSCLQVLMEEYSPPTNKVKTYGLSSNSEQLLLQRICEVIQPPKNPVNVKIFMRRAPTQEEFFRGTLSRNPVQLSQLSCPQEEPTVKHLRQYIADQLQMSDTAELIELLCANKILNLDLKLRVVQQVLWKNYLVENSSAGGIGTQMFFSTGSGISMVFSSERPDRRTNITADTPSSALPPMVVTYRLAGVDGEATEDLLESLIDPEAPMIGNLSSDEQERFLEKEFGQTKEVMHGQGVNILLRSIQSHIKDTLSRIRRDDVLFNYIGHGKRSEKNFSLANFEKSPPYSGLVLLKLCTKLASNCKKLVNARAPTILLRLLLEVFNTIDDTSLSDSNDPTSDQNAQIVSNPTALMLEDLIETLASDISSDDNREEDATEIDQSSSTLPLLLSSLKTIYLGPQLRKVIAKLLPFLTYGMSSLAKELAENFDLHIKVEKLCDCDAKEQPKTRRFVLMDTFVQAAVSLPPSGVCHSLRAELIKCGLVERLVSFILHGIPEEPPPWSFSLWLKEINKATSGELEQSWKYYFLRSGIKTAMEMLVGLARGHGGVQSLLATYLEGRFMIICHWIESTSDKKSSRIYLNGLGLLAETLLDEMKGDNPEITKSINSLRRKTRERKREIAEERRSKAMVSITSFGPSVVAGIDRTRPGMSDTIRSSASSFLAPVLEFFSSNSESLGVKALEQPAWMAEMEALEDETGLTCAVCQEGRTLQPKELLGLYCYVKKVSIPPNKCRGKLAIEGSLLLMNLPSSLPTSLVGTPIEQFCFFPAKSIGESLRKVNPSWYNTMINATNRRATQITTTVSAGNAIHYSCHAKARSADRSHPKAPKSEWEGASLRNSRVNCNAIMPLVSSQSSKVPLVAVESALNDYQTIITNQLGARPKAILWTVLNDVRLLLLRIAYGEALSADCGGGSLSSNISLLFYQLLLVDMFTNDASHDSPQTARHAQHLSGGFLAACKIVQAENLDSNNYSSLIDDIADAAPMAALTCISYHNTKDEALEHPEKDAKVPHPNCRWNIHKDVFFFGLIICAGRRHMLGADDSGCRSNRKSRPRQSSFSDWEAIEMRRSDGEVSDSTEKQKSSLRPMSKTNVLRIDDYATALRPMIILYALFDSLSAVYVPNMTDEMIQYSTAEIVKHVEVCHQAKGIHDLLRKAKIDIENDSIVEYLQLGMHSS